MPLLPLEPFLYPENLFSESAFELENPHRWWVLHTRPRAEKALARIFMARTIAFFLPVYQRKWRTRARDFQSYLPLFPGYVFLHGDIDARLTALETNLVANVLEVADQGQLFQDLTHVHRLINSGILMTPEARLVPGTRVEVTGGPLAGLEGKVLRQGKNLRIVVEVHFLQQGVSVELESWMIQPLEENLAQFTKSAAC